MKNGKAKIGYGYILVPMDFPDYDMTPDYDEWAEELLKKLERCDKQTATYQTNFQFHT